MPSFRAKTKTKNQRREVEKKGEEGEEDGSSWVRGLWNVTTQYENSLQKNSVTGSNLELSSGSLKKILECSNNNKITGFCSVFSVHAFLVGILWSPTLQKKGKTSTQRSPHIRAWLCRHTPCRALEHWGFHWTHFQLTSALNTLLTSF